MNWLIQLFRGIPSELAVMLIAALPITELRLALPLALDYYHLAWPAALAYSIVGTMIPGIAILYIFEFFYRIFDRLHPSFHKFFEWLFAHTRSKFGKRYELYGELALVILAAIPLPFFGSYTSALAAWLFGIKPRKAIPLIFLGVCLMGVIVLLLTLGVGRIF